MIDYSFVSYPCFTSLRRLHLRFRYSYPCFTSLRRLHLRFRYSYPCFTSLRRLHLRFRYSLRACANTVLNTEQPSDVNRGAE